MNREVLEFICKSQSSTLSLSTKLYYERTLIMNFDPNASILDVDLTLPYIEQLFDTDQPINYCVTPNLLIMGMVKDKSSPYSMIIGPMCIGEISEVTCRKIITSGKYPLKLDQLPNLITYLNKLPNMHVDKFINILCLIHVNMNHEIILSDEIMKSEAEYDIESEVAHNMLEQDEKISFQGVQRRNPHDFETEMLFCIKHGMSARLKSLNGKGNMLQTGTLALDTLRHYKNAMIILNSLSIRAAMAGGLNPETCYQLGEIYIRKIECCTDLKQLGAIGQSLRLDYCERVRELQHPHTDDPTINKAMHYINENVHKKITAEEVADLLAISREYLSTRFKNVTGTSLPDYINRQKVLEAKRLLRLTDKPLSEISEYLSYSSQSYFQNNFKKIVGITPLAYRNTQDEGIF